MSDQRMSSHKRKMCILSAVKSLFCNKGMAATSKELSEAAGVSEALIFRHFTNKEGIYQALLDESCHSHDSFGQELVEMEPSADVLVCAIYLLSFVVAHGIEAPENEFALTTDELRGLVLQSLQTDGEVAKTLFNNGYSPWVPHITKSITAAKKAGQFNESKKISAEQLLWMAHHSVMGIFLTFHPEPKDVFMADHKGMDEIVSNSAVFCLRGIGLKQEAIDSGLQSKVFSEFKNKLYNQLPKED